MSDCEGVYNFSPIILSPQACNLAVGHIQETLIPDGDGGYALVNAYDRIYLIFCPSCKLLKVSALSFVNAPYAKVRFKLQV